MQLIYAKNPYSLLDDAFEETIVQAGLSLTSLVRKNIGLKEFRLPTVCSVMNKDCPEGDFILQKDWSTFTPAKDDIIVFLTLPQGGGDGGSNPLALLATIALMVVAPYLAPGLAGVFGATSAFALGLAEAAIMVVGTMVINTLLPPNTADSSVGAGQPSSIYSLAGRQNTSKLGNVIPVLYGTHAVFPPYESAPYVTTVGSVQYLNVSLLLGADTIQVDETFVGGAPLSNFLAEPDPLVRAQVITRQTGPLGTERRYTSDAVSNLDLLPTNDPDYGVGWQGPFKASPVDPEGKVVKLVVILQAAIRNQNTNTLGTIAYRIQFRAAASNGVPAGEWLDAQTGTTTDSTYSYQQQGTSGTPVFLSHEITSGVSGGQTQPLPAGHYEVRAIRLNGKAETDISKLVLVNVQGVYENQLIAPNVTLYRITLRATNRLNRNTSSRIQCVLSRTLSALTYDGDYTASDRETSLTPAYLSEPGAGVTNSPARACKDILCHPRYGGDTPLQRLDITTLASLETEWVTNNLQFNAIFDNETTVASALNSCLLSALSSYFQNNGTFEFYQDQLRYDVGTDNRSLPSATFHKGNIVKDSLTLKRIPASSTTVSAIKGEYIDRQSWTAKEVTSGNPDFGTITVSLFGVSDHTQAKRITFNRETAARYRRRIASFKTKRMGFIPKKGSLIGINQQVLDSSTTPTQANILGVNYGYTTTFPRDITLKLDREVTRTGKHIRIVGKHLEVSSLLPATQSQPSDKSFIFITVNSQEDLDLLEIPEDNRLQTILIFDILTLPHTAIVTDITPERDGVGIVATLEEESLYAKQKQYRLRWAENNTVYTDEVYSDDGLDRLLSIAVSFTASYIPVNLLLTPNFIGPPVTGWGPALVGDAQTSLPSYIKEANYPGTKLLGYDSVAIESLPLPSGQTTIPKIVKIAHYYNNLKYIPILPSKQYQASCYMGAENTSGTITLAFYDSAKVLINSYSAAPILASEGIIGGSVLTDFRRLYIQHSSPANAAYASFQIERLAVVDDTLASQLSYTHAMFAEVPASATGQMPYDDNTELKSTGGGFDNYTISVFGTTRNTAESKVLLKESTFTEEPLTSDIVSGGTIIGQSPVPLVRYNMPNIKGSQFYPRFLVEIVMNTKNGLSNKISKTVDTEAGSLSTVVASKHGTGTQHAYYNIYGPVTLEDLQNKPYPPLYNVLPANFTAYKDAIEAGQFPFSLPDATHRELQSFVDITNGLNNNPPVVSASAVALRNGTPVSNPFFRQNITSFRMTGTATDIDGTIVSYRWEENGILLSTNRVFDHTFPRPAVNTTSSHTLLFSATDSSTPAATSSTTLHITVSNYDDDDDG